MKSNGSENKNQNNADENLKNRGFGITEIYWNDSKTSEDFKLFWRLFIGCTAFILNAIFATISSIQSSYIIAFLFLLYSLTAINSQRAYSKFIHSKTLRFVQIINIILPIYLSRLAFIAITFVLVFHLSKAMLHFGYFKILFETYGDFISRLIIPLITLISAIYALNSSGFNLFLRKLGLVIKYIMEPRKDNDKGDLFSKFIFFEITVVAACSGCTLLFSSALNLILF